VVVNFWATWCGPCRDEMPSMQRLKERMAGAPFALLAVNYAEGNPRVEAFLQKVPVDFAILMDRDSTVSKRWQAGAALHGRARSRTAHSLHRHGGARLERADVEATLRKLLRPQ
jgi:thiol-disulfide isomerase/thioredoxin